MDSFISTMETNALMGMNVARLVVDDFLDFLLESGPEASGQIPIQAGRKENEL
jgi:prenylcysteine oxidase/farnesylcysteine lyase